MKKLLLFCMLVASKLNGQDSHVLFGERNITNTNLSLYIDRQGCLYPSYKISNKSLEKSDGSLEKWYSENQMEFIVISRVYNCFFNEFNSDNCKTLNDSIINFNLRKINGFKSPGFQSITFLIHGFRKPYISLNGDVSSPYDFQIMEDGINKYSQSKTVFVEIYWDALYSPRPSANIKQNERTFHLFEMAQENAVMVGKTLKKVLVNLKHDTVNVVTHSLGAKVAIYALLNANSNDNSITPSNNRINICLIAPAISGQLIADNYYNRNSIVNYKTIDNYHLSIVYNEEDFVLRKKLGIFGPGPYKYGNTTLGCNYDKACDKLKETFLVTFPKSKIELFNLTSVGKCHLVRCYYGSEKIQEMLKNVNK